MIAIPVPDTPPALVAPAPAQIALQTAPSPQNPPATVAPADPQPAPGAAPDATQPPSAQPAVASASPVRPQSRQPQDVHLLGDWFGIRRTLVDAGITPTLAYTSQSLAAVRGGTTSQMWNAGQFTAGVALDLEKITGAVPGVLQVTITRRHGDSLNSGAGLNFLVNPLSIQGRGETWRFSQISYRTTIGKLGIKIGRLILNEDFNQSRCDFVNGYFCLGDNTRAYSTIWPTNPVSQWAIRLQYNIAKNVVIKTAVYQYNPKNLDMTRNFYVGFKGATGVTVPAEIVYTPRLWGKLSGTYTAGFYYSNADMDDPVLNTLGQIRSIYKGSPLVRHAEWGGYVDARQQIVAPRKDGSHSLSVFFNLSVASQDSTPNASAMALGLNYTGLLPGRPRDELGLAFGRGRLNNRITEAARYIDANHLGNVPVRTNEFVIESYYGINVVPGLVLQPDAQLIVNPAGDSKRRNAVLLGFKSSVTL